MSKSQKQNNREPKKPRQLKPKVVASVVASLMTQGKSDISACGRKRW